MSGSARGAPYDFFGDALVECAQPFELLEDIRSHSLADPVHSLAECEACVIVDEKRLIRRCYVQSFAELVEVFSDDMLAYPHKVLIEDVPVAGVIKMHNGLLVVERELKRRYDGTFYAVEGVVLVDDPLGLFQDDALDKGRKVSEVVIESIAVDSALCHYVLYRYL